VRPDDRPGNELWEEGNKEQEIDEITGRRELPPVDVDGVAHGLEGVERNAYRQQQLVQGQAERKKLVEAMGKKVVVLEDGEQAKVARQAENEEQPPQALVLAPRDEKRGVVVDDGGEEEQK